MTPKIDNCQVKFKFLQFSCPKSEVDIVRRYLFDPDDTPKPSEVGEAAFKRVLAEAK